MADYQSAYTGVQIDSAVDKVTNNVYTKSEIDTNLSQKVDKEEGKGLSSNDYTLQDLVKVANISFVNDKCAVGQGSQAPYSDSTALGGSSYAAEPNSTALGAKSKAGNNCVAVGTSSDANLINAVAVGADSSIRASYTVAVGTSSKANSSYGVALGYGSIVNDYDGSAVSVGSGNSTDQNTYTRKIINVTDPTNAQDVATKNYVDNAIANQGQGSNIIISSGTWTPALGGKGGIIPSHDVYYSEGKFLRIGNLVYIICNAKFRINNKNFRTGTACIKDLPFKSATLETENLLSSENPGQALMMSKCEGLSEGFGGMGVIQSGKTQIYIMDINGEKDQEYVLSDTITEEGDYGKDIYISFNGCYLIQDDS